MERVKELIRFRQINQDCKEYDNMSPTNLNKFKEFCEMGENDWIKMNLYLSQQQRYYLQYHNQEKSRKRYQRICNYFDQEFVETDFLEYFDHEKEWMDKYLSPEEERIANSIIFSDLLQQLREIWRRF